MTFLKLGLLSVALLYLCAATAMYFMQRSFQYFPTHRAPTPEMVGLSGVSSVTLDTADGVTVQMWHAPATPGQPTILFFHGNAGEIADRAPRLAAYQAAGLGAAFVSYRGYGASGGAPSEEGFLHDARAAYHWLLAQGVPAAQIVVVGESLGTGVAVKLAASVPVGALILGAPYAAAVDLAARHYPWLPVRLLMKDQFRSIDDIPHIKTPLLILHGTDDTVIPISAAEKLFAAAHEPKTFVPLPAAGHDVLFAPDIWTREIAFIAALSQP